MSALEVRDIWLGLALVSGILVGCGKGVPTPAPTLTDNGSEPDGVPGTREEVVPELEPQPVDPNQRETQWIGTIPYDVFWDQPLEIAADRTVVTAPADAPTGDPGPELTSTPGAPSRANDSEGAGSAGEIDWSRALPSEMLIDEIKILRTRLTQNLQTVGTYNRNVDVIALDSAVLGTLGAIAAVHPDGGTWIPKGKYIRELGFQVSFNASGTGRTPFQATKEPFEQVLTVMDGGPPPDGDFADDVRFADAVSLSDMMLRMDGSFNSLKSNINTESRMKEDSSFAVRELHLMAAFGLIMGTKGYDSVDEKMYRGFVETFVSASLEGVSAVKTEDFRGFQAALNVLQTSCGECHNQYRGSDDGF